METTKKLVGMVLPCPFCGGDKQTYIRDMLDRINEIHIIRCEGCLVSMSDTNEKKVFAAWNMRRAPEVPIH